MKHTKISACRLADLVFDRIADGSAVHICGNGDCMLIAMHYALDWTKNINWPKQYTPLFNVLGSNPGLLTALANDTYYARVFSEQIRYQAKPNDFLIALSASGTSQNVMSAIVTALLKGLHAIFIHGTYAGEAFTSFGVTLADDAVEEIKIPGSDIMEVEDNMFILGHEVIRELRRRTGASSP